MLDAANETVTFPEVTTTAASFIDTTPCTSPIVSPAISSPPCDFSHVTMDTLQELTDGRTHHHSIASATSPLSDRRGSLPSPGKSDSRRTRLPSIKPILQRMTSLSHGNHTDHEQSIGQSKSAPSSPKMSHRSHSLAQSPPLGVRHGKMLMDKLLRIGQSSSSSPKESTVSSDTEEK